MVYIFDMVDGRPEVEEERTPHQLGVVMPSMVEPTRPEPRLQLVPAVPVAREKNKPIWMPPACLPC